MGFPTRPGVAAGRRQHALLKKVREWEERLLQMEKGGEWPQQFRQEEP